MGTIFVDNLEPQSGTSLSLGASGDTIALTSGAIQSNLLQPSFHAQKTDSQQVINNASFTKITFNNEIFDTDNKFADSRFTPTIAGKYFIYGAWGTNTSAEITQMQCVLYKNGSVYQRGMFYNTELNTATVSCNVILDSDDYVEIYAYHNRGSAASAQHDNFTCFFGGYRIGT